MIMRRFVAPLLASIATIGVVHPSPAQTTGDGFLFKAPRATLGFRGGFNRALASSDVFSFVTDQLTLRRGDFSSITLGANLAIRVTPRISMVLDLAYAGAKRLSEFRDWVDQNNLPIQQTTSFRRLPVTLSVRRYFTADGRSIGHFAWIPARSAAYVGVGAGWMWYSFRQSGDFIDFKSLRVAYDEYKSSGWTPTLHAAAGIDVSLSQFFAVNGEARFTWAKAKMGQDFVNFDRIDLSGFTATAGLVIRM